ncbi:hypothetical protein CJ738_35040, partial [Klebsiella pneumoniae]
AGRDRDGLLMALQSRIAAPGNCCAVVKTSAQLAPMDEATFRPGGAADWLCGELPLSAGRDRDGLLMALQSRIAAPGNCCAVVKTSAQLA